VTQDFKEILEYLEPRHDYIIWAGFAVFAHLGIEHSPDVDIYVISQKVKSKISSEFQKRGWQKFPHMEVVFDWDKLEKNGTSFDIIYSKPASQFMFSDITTIEVYGHKLRFLSREWLFLTKLGQLTYSERKLSKRKRDILTLRKLRKLIDIEKVSQLATKLPLSYWKSGDI
jgi:hypothetical protein